MSKISWSQALADYLKDETTSYAYIAQKYGVSKRSVTKRAVQEGWQGLKQRTSLKVHQKLPEKLGESIAEVNAKHAQIGKWLQGIALRAMRSKADGGDELKPQNINDARLLYLTGFHVERKSLGLEDKNKNTDAYVPGRKMYIVLPPKDERVGI